ncbi:hypothetical protein SAMN05216429_102240 [Marinobacter persicus]|uniref:Uncharacterized protein n=1 Tax=Marinobacter persicus TaxID=930118 RepID=A0A1I3R2X9_9GAMM|nr:hypothetical protein [Marinobacter persicus]GHD43486.1 hypothetical protein GCM10008110_07490 [Marinobacter persicus]SFJ40894.1 hypothetical protein SAMN05216429_102240 [Marinobacter persicus]
MINEQVRKLKQSSICELAERACLAWAERNFNDHHFYCAKLIGMKSAFVGVDCQLVNDVRDSLDRVDEFCASGAKDFHAWAVGQACNVLKVAA